MARSGATVFVMGDGELYFCGKNTKANLFGCGAGGAGTKIPVPTRSVDRPPFNVERAAVFDDGNTGLCMASGALWSRGSGVLEALGLGRFDTKESGFASRTDDWERLDVGGAVVAVSVGGLTAAALTAGGELKTWGSGGRQLGQGDSSSSSCYTPTPVVGLPQPVVAVALGGAFGLLLAQDRRVFRWGPKDEPTPQPLPALAGVVAIAAGDDHAMAVGGGGELYSWGNNSNGRTGHGTTKKRTAAPTVVAALVGERVLLALDLEVILIPPCILH
jgi:alpha-tubulin suppressor-like RCC1 family protein